MKRNTDVFHMYRLPALMLGLAFFSFSCGGPANPINPIRPAAVPDPYLQVRYDTIRVNPSDPSGGSTLAQVQESMGGSGTKRALTAAERSSSEAALNPGSAGGSGRLGLQSMSVVLNPIPSYTDKDVQIFMGALEAYEWADSSGKSIIVIVLNPDLIDPSQLSPGALRLLQSMGTAPRVIFKAAAGWQLRRLQNDPELQVKYSRINQEFDRLAQSGPKIQANPSPAAALALLAPKVSDIQAIMGTPGAKGELTAEERSRYKRDILRRAGPALKNPALAASLGSPDELSDYIDKLFDSLVIYQWIQSGKGITVYFMDVSKAIDALLPIMRNQLKSASPQAAVQFERALNILKTLFKEPILVAPALPIGWMPENPRL